MKRWSIIRRHHRTRGSHWFADESWSGLDVSTHCVVISILGPYGCSWVGTYHVVGFQQGLKLTEEPILVQSELIPQKIPLPTSTQSSLRERRTLLFSRVAVLASYVRTM